MPSKRKIIGVVGVRDYKGILYDNTTHVVSTLEDHIRKEGLILDSVKIITGGGRGVEQIVVKWCEANSVPYRKIPPNIEAHGPTKAFTRRNNMIVADSDQLIVYWDGIISIPRECIGTAVQMQKKVTVYPVL